MTRTTRISRRALLKIGATGLIATGVGFGSGGRLARIRAWSSPTTADEAAFTAFVSVSSTAPRSWMERASFQLISMP
jgi:hypothetical protein